VTSDRNSQDSMSRSRRRSFRSQADDDANLDAPDTGDVIRSISGLAASWTRAGAHLLFDTASVVNDLGSDLADSLIDSITPARASAQQPAFRSGGGSARASGDPERRWSRAPLVDRVNTTVSRALRDVSDVISQTAAEVGRAYDVSVTDNVADAAATAEPRRRPASTSAEPAGPAPAPTR